MYDLGMFGKPIDVTKNAIVIIPDWKYNINKNITHRDRKCCDGSKRDAPILRKLTITFSSCAVQRVKVTDNVIT